MFRTHVINKIIDTLEGNTFLVRKQLLKTKTPVTLNMHVAFPYSVPFVSNRYRATELVTGF